MLKAFLSQYFCNEAKASAALKQFDVYRALLLQWNQKFNLTAITQPDEIDTKHFIDSMLGADDIYGKVLDIGAGAGFPSLPLCFVRPDCTFTMVDALFKRVTFLNEVIVSLNLTSVKAIHARAEDLPKNELYDTAVARAVAPLRSLCEYALPFVKIGGKFVAYKSQDIEEEINESKAAIKILGGKIKTVKEISLFGTDVVRKLVIIEKTAPTPKQYPRGKNKPKTEPL